MLILASDTSGASCAVCLLEDDVVRAEAFLSLGLTHSETYMPLLDDMMKTAGYTYEQVDVFASAVGPGSFTGIRIGVSAVKTMAMVYKKPAVPISSLKALAFPFFMLENTLVLPMLDARNKRTFAAGYWEGQLVIEEGARSVEECFSSAASFMEEKGKGKLLLCGNAAELYREEALEKGLPVMPLFAGSKEIKGASVAYLAKEAMLSADSVNHFSAALLSPEYFAKTSAERIRDEKNEKEST